MRKFVCLFTMSLLLIFVVACNKGSSAKSEAEADAIDDAVEEVEVVIPVQAETPHRNDIASYFETTARVEAENRVQVMAESVGECKKVCVQEGDLVKSGQLLAELDKETMLAAIGQTEVQVRQTKTAYDIAERSLAEGIGAKAERDNAKFAHEQAVAGLNSQKVQLNKMVIQSPITGIVTKKSVQEGQLVAAANPVFTIVDPQSYILVINPPEKELARLKVGQVAKVTFDALGAEEFNASVRRINPSVDSSTGTVKVTLDFDEATRSKLRESAFARVRLVLDTHENALLIPKDSLVEENARKYVFVVKQDRVETPAAAAAAPEASSSSEPQNEAPKSESADVKTPAAPEKPTFVSERVEVRTGLEDSKDVEILSGIDDNMLIVTLGQHTLKPGSKVTITNATDELLSRGGLSAEEALKIAKEKREGQARRKAKVSHKKHF